MARMSSWRDRRSSVGHTGSWRDRTCLGTGRAHCLVRIVVWEEMLWRRGSWLRWSWVPWRSTSHLQSGVHTRIHLISSRIRALVVCLLPTKVCWVSPRITLMQSRWHLLWPQVCSWILSLHLHLLHPSGHLLFPGSLFSLLSCQLFCSRHVGCSDSCGVITGHISRHRSPRRTASCSGRSGPLQGWRGPGMAAKASRRVAACLAAS